MGAKKFYNGVKNSPSALQLLSARATLRLLEDACKSPHSPADISRLRELCARTIPRTLRQLLIEELLKSGRLYNTLQLCALDALLTADVRRLAVRHVRRWYRAHFLDLLSSGRAEGLQVLLFEDITWLTGNPVASSPLALALAHLPNLLQVSLRFVCDDRLLSALGRSCPHLEEIDASGSAGVTDAGLQWLCIKNPPPALAKARQADRAGGRGTWRATRRFCRRVFFDCFLETALDEEAALPAWWRASVIRRAKKNACCDTLRKVTVTSTGVTAMGVELVRVSAPGATVVANTLTNKKVD